MDVQLLNFSVSLARSVGLSLILAVAGAVVLVRAKNKTLREPFLVLSFLGLTPTLFLRQYTGFYILPFIALFGALAITAVTRMRRPRIRKTLVVGLFAVILVFSATVLNYEVEHTTWLPNTMYSTSLYAGHYARGENLVSNDGLVGIRVASICQCAYIPVGGAGTTFQSPELLAYGFFTASDVLENTVRVPLQDLTLESDSPWIASTIQAQADWVQIMQSSFDSQGAAMSRYDPMFYVENEHLESRFFAYGNTYPSMFAATVHEGAYKLYDNDVETLWFVDAPRAT